MRSVLISAGLMLLVSSVPGVAMGADPATLFKPCAACHGAKGEGNDRVGAPNIAAMPAWYVARQLDNFAVGRRGAAASDTFGAQMRAAVGGVAASDREALAKYVAGLPNYSRGDTAPKAGDAERRAGATQYNAICSACHGAQGRGNQPLAAPPLAGVSPAYLARQLAAFRAGTRGAHADDTPGKQMATMAKTLRDAAAERNVIAYIATLKP